VRDDSSRGEPGGDPRTFTGGSVPVDHCCHGKSARPGSGHCLLPVRCRDCPGSREESCTGAAGDERGAQFRHATCAKRPVITSISSRRWRAVRRRLRRRPCSARPTHLGRLLRSCPRCRRTGSGILDVRGVATRLISLILIDPPPASSDSAVAFEVVVEHARLGRNPSPRSSVTPDAAHAGLASVRDRAEPPPIEWVG
jgi:hypothetical protein